jgi:hypothetical protein
VPHVFSGRYKSDVQKASSWWNQRDVILDVKGWIDRRVFCEWLKEDRVVRRDPYGREQVTFMDNVAGHKALENIENEVKRAEMETVMTGKLIDIRFLPANSTDLCQPADTGIIQKSSRSGNNDGSKRNSAWR